MTSTFHDELFHSALNIIITALKHISLSDTKMYLRITENTYTNEFNIKGLRYKAANYRYGPYVGVTITKAHSGWRHSLSFLRIYASLLREITAKLRYGMFSDIVEYCICTKCYVYAFIFCCYGT